MSIVFISEWYKNIPPVERDLPVLYYRGRTYTPRDIYNEVMSETKLGDELQRKIEELHSASSFGIEDIKGLDYIAKERVNKIIQNLPDNYTIVAIENGRRIIVSKNEFFKTKLYKEAVEEEKKKVIRLLGGGG